MFPTTHRSVVIALGSADGPERARAFDALAGLYWKPLYKYLRVARHLSSQDAEDVTQGFFARAFEKETLATWDPQRGAFRTFLRMLVDRHLLNEQKSAARVKRGGNESHFPFDEMEAEIGRQPSTSLTPEDYFQHEWIRSVFTVAVDRLREAFANRPTQFALFEEYDLGDDRHLSYRELAERFGLSETAVTNHLAAVRRQFRRTVLDLLREITGSDAEFRAEARALLGVDA
jgi:RNA polymerase sigma factor (sigma-70 family)